MAGRVFFHAMAKSFIHHVGYFLVGECSRSVSSEYPKVDRATGDVDFVDYVGDHAAVMAASDISHDKATRSQEAIVLSSQCMLCEYLFIGKMHGLAAQAATDCLSVYYISFKLSSRRGNISPAGANKTNSGETKTSVDLCWPQAPCFCLAPGGCFCLAPRGNFCLATSGLFCWPLLFLLGPSVFWV